MVCGSFGSPVDRGRAKGERAGEDASVQYPKRGESWLVKRPCQVGRWRAYESGLRSRGDLTVWLSEDAIQCWRPSGRRKPGGKKRCTNLAIETVPAVRLLHHHLGR